MASQISIMGLSNPDAMSFESCENATDLTESLRFLRVCLREPVATSQTSIPSLVPEATSFESWEIVTELTKPPS